MLPSPVASVARRLGRRSVFRQVAQLKSSFARDNCQQHRLCFREPCVYGKFGNYRSARISFFSFIPSHQSFHVSLSQFEKQETLDPTSTLFPPQENRGKNPFRWLLKFAGFYSDESTHIRQTTAMYQSCLLQSSGDDIYTELGIEESFYFRHSLIILHIWLLHHRLRSLKNIELQKDLQEHLFDRVWDDTLRRVRALGVQELSVNKYVRDTQTFSFGAAVAYDYGLSSDDHELGSSLFRNLFAGRDEIPDEKVLSMVKYVRDQVTNLAEHGDDDIVAGNIKWLSLPGSTNAVAGHDEWREALSEDGRIYWWNTKTRQSTWENPIVPKHAD